MTAVRNLDQLMNEAIRDVRAEAAFFRALLDASLFIHEPRTQPPVGRRQFVIFRSPDDGQYVVPVFTDRGKADFAAKNNARVRVVEMIGRDLMRLTLGTPLMLNPNDARATLYPEEIERLLRDGTIVSVQSWRLGTDADRSYYKLKSTPRALIRALRATLVKIPKVAVAYLAGITSPDANQPDSVLIVLGADGSAEQPVVRAVAASLADQLRDEPQPVDVAYFNAAGPALDWMRRLELQPVYRRRPKPSQSNRSVN